MVVVQGDAELLEVVEALRSSRGFAGRLYRRQQQCDENANDRDNNQKFHQGETSAVLGFHLHFSLKQLRWAS